MQLNDILLVDPATGISHNAVRQPETSLQINSPFVMGQGAKHHGIGSAAPSFKVSMWILQTSQANAETVIEQILEITSNAYYQPVYMAWKDGATTNLDGWYVIEKFDPDYGTISTGKVKVEFMIRKVAALGGARAIATRDASLSLAVANSTALGLPNDAATTATTFTRTAADGTDTIAYGLPGNGAYQLTSTTPDFTRRCRIYDRNTGGAASTLGSGAITLTGWQEVYGPDHFFASDCIMQNGLVMVNLAAGSQATIYHYLNAAWVQTAQVALVSNSQNCNVRQVTILRLSPDEIAVKASVSNAGGQGQITFRIQRGLVYVDCVGMSPTGTSNLIFTHPKVIKVIANDTGASDGSFSDAMTAPSTYSFMTGISSDATQTWLPTIGTATLSAQASSTTTTTVLPSVAAGASQRASFSAQYVSGGTAKYQIESESQTLVGGATNVVDASASAGHAAQCLVAGAGFTYTPNSILANGNTMRQLVRVRTDNTAQTIEQIGTMTGANTKQLAIAAAGGSTYGWGSNGTDLTVAAGTLGWRRADYPSVVLLDNPYRYYKLADTNTNAIDSSINARTGTYQGTYTQAQGGIAGDLTTLEATLFDGVSGRVVTALPQPTSTTGFTLEAWVKSTSTNNAPQIICSFGVSGASGQYMGLYLNAGNAGTGTYNDDVQEGTSIADGAFHHVVAVLNLAVGVNGTLYIYRDGVFRNSLARTNAWNPASDATGNRIGCRVTSGSVNQQFFNGTIAHAVFYTYALSADRIAAHYNAGSNSGGVFFDESVILPLTIDQNAPLPLWKQWSSDKLVRSPVLG